MTKYIIGEFFSSGGATLYKNPSDQTVTQINSLGHNFCIEILARVSLHCTMGKKGSKIGKILTHTAKKYILIWAN